MVKSRNGATASNGKYVAKVCHYQEVGFDEFAERIEKSCTLTKSDIIGCLTAFGRELANDLREGNSVRLPYLGLFKLEMACTPVDDPDDFDPKKHLNRFKLHVLPESKNKRQELYSGIHLEKAKD